MLKNFFTSKKRLIIYTVIIFCILLFGITFCYFYTSHDSPSSSKETAAGKKFNNYIDSLFASLLSDDTLSMHFYIADTNAFFQMDFPQTFGTISYSNMENSQSDYIDQIKYLKTFNYSDLTRSQKITYDILLYYFQTELDFADLCECYDCLSPTTGIQAQLPILLSEYQFYSSKDIDNYLSLLSKMPKFFDNIVAFEKEKISNETFMSKRNCEEIIEQCLSFSRVQSAEDNFLYTTFQSRINSCDFLSDSQASSYCQKNKEYLSDYVIPSYKNLAATLDSLKNAYYTDDTSCNPTLPSFSNGKAYYEYLVRSRTGSSKTVEEIKSAIQKQVSSDMTNVSALFTSNPDLENSFYASSVSSLTDPNEILKDLMLKISGKNDTAKNYFKDVCQVNNISYDLKFVEDCLQDYLSPAFYLSPPIDLPKNHVIYVNQSPKFENQDLYVTLAHEGFPGHLYQNYVFSKTSPPKIRHILNFGGYTEGWATYAEFLSYNYETSDSTLASALSSSASFSLGLYSLVDIGVNYEGWSMEDTSKFLNNYGFSDSAICDEIYYSVTESPANYLQYYVGFLEICELRDSYLQQHPEKNGLSKFHKFILEFGPAPFEVIEKWMND